MAIRLGNRTALLTLLAALGAGSAFGQTDRPRFVILLDNSTSMTESLDTPAIQTHGDGSEAHPGCDVDGKGTAGWAYDDSRLFLAKSAVIDTISAFGAAEFALATYSRTLLGQPCTGDGDCTAILPGTSCVDVPGDTSAQKYCVRHGYDGYLECPSGTGCVRCSNSADSNDLLFDWGSFDCLAVKCSFAQGCIGGQIIVGFPGPGTSNLPDIYRWIDGKEDLPPFSATSNRELRAVTMTPIGSALESMRAWLFDATKTNVGPGAGVLSADPAARDPRIACRPYNVILITDGDDTCSPSASDPINAAAAMYKLGVNLYVVGFGSGSSASLNNIALAGSGETRQAFFAGNRSELIARLGDILMNAMPKPKCNCDATCYDTSLAFPLKGQSCAVGVGRCKRQGVYACNSAEDGVVCANEAACGAAPLVPGVALAEQCGILPGCVAPTEADCADEDCDGLIDEGLSCSCSAKAEVCNGIDDNCDGVVDNIAAAPCGLDLGACKPGVTVCASDGAGGLQVTCQGGTTPSPELCDGIDNDCNGVVDDLARACYPDGTSGCIYDDVATSWVCAGGCRTGMQACKGGAWRSCVGMVVPSPETACDGIDNNCDGKVDENDPLPVSSCYPPSAAGCDATTGKCVGQCALGFMACAANKMGLACAGARTPMAELCNGKDDDCDGTIDEVFPTLGQPCNQQSCQGAGQFVCNATGTDVECSVTAAGPTPEVCDGRDNDCDGLVDEVPDPGQPAMPGVGVACGTDVGECVPGIAACVAGKIACVAMGPTPEICDGKDNDCNGSIDDGVLVPGSECNPEGLAPNQPLAGDCRAGTFVCRGSEGWQCKGGRGPATEVCDGKDNDCDGVVDNQARCAAGYVCLAGECVPTCDDSGEFYRPCPADRYCKEGVCLVKACALQTCAVGLVCRSSDGKCIDPCAETTCPLGANCVNGACVDCYTRGCPTGQRCIHRQCAVDPCDEKTCEAGQFCYAGACVASCSGISCADTQECVQGSCVKSACPTSCPVDFFCDAQTRTCRPRSCSTMAACASGEVCVNATARCTNNPCELVHCAIGQSCIVKDDGSPDCVSPTVSGITQKATTEGGGCSCSLLARSQHGGGMLLLALGALLALRRRRRSGA